MALNKVPMTPKMMQVLKYFKKYYTKHEMSPTRRKMQVDLGYASPNSITVLVDKLVERGDIIKIAPHKARNLELNGQGS
jgi:SOS-response transcriptional repressor LexA